mgnify:CR=1 FL=1
MANEIINYIGLNVSRIQKAVKAEKPDEGVTVS